MSNILPLKITDPRRFSQAGDDLEKRMETVFGNFKSLDKAIFGNTVDASGEQAQPEKVVYYRVDLDPPEARVKLNGKVYKFTLTLV